MCLACVLLYSFERIADRRPIDPPRKKDHAFLDLHHLLSLRLYAAIVQLRVYDPSLSTADQK